MGSFSLCCFSAAIRWTFTPRKCLALGRQMWIPEKEEEGESSGERFRQTDLQHMSSTECQLKERVSRPRVLTKSGMWIGVLGPRPSILGTWRWSDESLCPQEGSGFKSCFLFWKERWPYTFPSLSSLICELEAVPTSPWGWVYDDDDDDKGKDGTAVQLLMSAPSLLELLVEEDVRFASAPLCTPDTLRWKNGGGGDDKSQRVRRFTDFYILFLFFSESSSNRPFNCGKTQ